MPHAPLTRPPRTRRPHRHRHRRHGLRGETLVTELRPVLADAHGLDLARLRAHPDAPPGPSGWLPLLGDGPLRTGADALARLDALARVLVDRMRAAGWDEGEAPRAVTSVLAASVPAAEAVLLRAARSRLR